MDKIDKEKKYTLYIDKKKYTRSQLEKMIDPGIISGLDIHETVVELFNTLLTAEEKEIVRKFYRTDKDSDNFTFNFLDYVPFLGITSTNRFVYFLGGIWSPIAPHDVDRAEYLFNYIVDKYAKNDYERADEYYSFAICVYNSCERTDKNKDLIIKYYLKNYDLKDVWFFDKDKMNYDYFWNTLCKLLKERDRLDEAIEIATFAFENNAYDKSKGGWGARLEKLIKAKQKESDK
jgi:tetratricopeptide (TPR) repeat protein